MFQNTFQNVLMFQNNFEMFPKQILIFQNKLKFYKVIKTGQSIKQVQMFRNTSENVLIFQNNFEMFPKQILVF